MCVSMPLSCRERLALFSVRTDLSSCCGPGKLLILSNRVAGSGPVAAAAKGEARCIGGELRIGKASWRCVGSRPASGALVQATAIAEESMGWDAGGREAMFRRRLTGGGDDTVRNNCEGGVSGRAAEPKSRGEAGEASRDGIETAAGTWLDNKRLSPC